MKELPKSAIPELHDPLKFREWHERKTSGKHFYGKSDIVREAWLYNGERGMFEEYAEFISPLLEHAESILKKKRGFIKIVSFGGGMLFGVLELRETLGRKAKELGLVPNHIQFVDYSLTKKLGLIGIKKAGAEALLTDETIRLHIGPIELRELQDAKDADIMVSAKGPFYHTHKDQQLIEVVAKTCKKLADGGRAFLEGRFYGVPKLDREILEGVRSQLGAEYLVDHKTGKGGGGGYFDIQRK